MEEHSAMTSPFYWHTCTFTSRLNHYEVKSYREGCYRRSDGELTAYAGVTVMYRMVIHRLIKRSTSFKPVNQVSLILKVLALAQLVGQVHRCSGEPCHTLPAAFGSAGPVLDSIRSVVNCDFSRSFCTGLLLCIIRSFIYCDTISQEGCLPFF